jgi:apolipoprotein N-acyltransferase
VAHGAELLVTITNDAWFARGNGARQHYDMGRMRAIETRRYLLRAGLDGITGVVDPLGESVAELPRGIPATLVAHYSLSDELTPWVRYGSWLVPLLLGWTVLGTAGRFIFPAD